MAKRAFVSDKQKQNLIDMLQNDNELRSGKFSNQFTHKIAKKKWEKVANQLNSIPGASKTAVQWKKTWQDLKKNVKKKNTELRQHIAGTGGGPPLKQIVLSSQDEQLINIIGETAIEGLPNIQESTVTIDTCDEEIITNMEQINNEEIVDELSVPLDEITNNDHSYNLKRKMDNLKRQKFSKKQMLTANHEMISVADRDVNIKEQYYEQQIQVLQSYYKEKLNIQRESLEIKKQKLKILQDDVCIKKTIAGYLSRIIE